MGLGVGEVGYLITGVKDVRQSKVGDTVTTQSKPASQALPGYTDPLPMVFSGIYPIDGSDYPVLREARQQIFKAFRRARARVHGQAGGLVDHQPGLSAGENGGKGRCHRHGSSPFSPTGPLP